MGDNVDDKPTTCGKIIQNANIMLTIFFVFLSIFSIVTAVTSFSLLQKSVSNVGDIIDNWRTVPVTDVAIVPTGGACPSGYVKEFSNQMKWPGAYLLGCACPPSATSFGQIRYSTVTTSACNTNQTLAGCVSSNNGDPYSDVSLNFWRKSEICVVRKGEPVVTWDSSAVDPPSSSQSSGNSNSKKKKKKKAQKGKKGKSSADVRPRPVLQSDKITRTCPSSYKVCGKDDRAICQVNTEQCPLTSLSTSPVSNKISNRFYDYSTYLPRTNAQFVEFNSSGLLFLDRSQSVINNTLPVIELKLAFADITLSSGPCLNGPSQQKYSSKLKFSNDNSQYQKKCSKVDDRYQLFDYMPESNLLLENFLMDPRCRGLSPLQAQNSDKWGLSSSLMPSEQVCTEFNGKSPRPLDCEVRLPSSYSGTRANYCGISDATCLNIIWQTRCGSLMHYAKSVMASKTVGLFYRNEIYWSSGCEISYNEIKSNRGPLIQAIAAQQALMVINCLVNSIMIIFNFIVLFNQLGWDNPCIPGKGDLERRIIDKWTEYFQVLARAAKLVPLLITIIVLAQINKFFIQLAASNCSDPLTNSLFDYLGKSLPEVQTSNILTLVIDLIQTFIQPVVMYAYNKMFPAKVEPTDQKGESPGGNVPMYEMVQSNEVNASSYPAVGHPQPHQQQQVMIAQTQQINAGVQQVGYVAQSMPQPMGQPVMMGTQQMGYMGQPVQQMFVQGQQPAYPQQQYVVMQPSLY